ncbi:MAG: hypothetical protein HQK52_01810 [Oligoflexia bacterium]|nr:hypothetical protein [Oligoflexia bacterium]
MIKGRENKFYFLTFAFLAIVLILALAIFELMAYLCFKSRIYIPNHMRSVTIIENTAPAYEFDPSLGYKISSTPLRFAKITKGVVEYSVVRKGNNLGLHAVRDYYPQKDSKEIKRFIVFGDSFSAGEYLEKTWVDRFEEMAKKEGKNIELLNFSIMGGGLGNWWRALDGILRSEHYDVDGVIFAITTTVINRKFFWHENTEGEISDIFGYVPSWDPKFFPGHKNSLQQSYYYRYLDEIYKVSNSQFEEVMAKKQNTIRYKTYARYYLARFIVAVKKFWPTTYLAYQKAGSWLELVRQWRVLGTQGVLDLGRENLIDDINVYVQEKKMPCFVIHIPTREDLKTGEVYEETKRLSTILNATLIDGSLAFQDIPVSQAKDYFLPYDNHWNQKGSDLFAGFIFKKLSENVK